MSEQLLVLPDLFPGVQFSRDPEALNQFFRQMVPNTNGVTQDELVETITHLAFYVGWPSAMTVVSVAKEVFEKK